MAVSRYRTKKGIRYLAEAYQDGARVAAKAGFKTKLEALQWERQCLKPTLTSMQPDLALYQVVTLYLLDAEQRRKKNTLSYKKSVLKKFTAFIGKDESFKTIDRQDVKSFLSKYSKEVSPKSANKYRVELSALWSWAQVEGHSLGNPARQVEPFSVTRHIRYVPPREHIAKALKHASQFECDFLMALLHTAARISELRELTWNDVDLERRTIRLWTSKRRGGNRESRTLALSPSLHDVFSRLNEERVGGELYVFTNPLTGTCYTRQSKPIKYLFQNVCKKAEVPLFTAHSIRHYVATHFNDPRRAQKMLGHGNLKTTEIYLHDLGVDTGLADVFEAITNEITNDEEQAKKEGPTVLQ